MDKSSKKGYVVTRFVARAPALSAAGPVEADQPLLRAAISLAAPGLPQGALRARRRYAERAAFRATPAGLLAGVALGRLGEATGADFGPPSARLTLGWSRMAALGRALLGDPALRAGVRLRCAPSLLCDGHFASWIGRGEGALAPVERAEIDRLLAAAIGASERWTPFALVRAKAARAAGSRDPEALDEWLLEVVDSGLLHSDLEPPLIGPPPGAWMARRLARLRPRPACAEEVAALVAALAAVRAIDPRLASRIDGWHERIEGLPGARGERRGLSGALAFPRARVTLARAAVERAARAAEAAAALQAALGATDERGSPALSAALAELLETREPGAYPIAQLDLGWYGVAFDGAGAPLAAGAPTVDATAPPRAVAPRLLARLVEAVAAGGEARFTSEELGAAGDLGATLELILAPCVERAGEPPGDGWLLGLHAPAGATWGRAAVALERPLAAAFAELERAEAAVLGDAERIDVAFGAGEAAADAACHPPLRRTALALSSWPDGPAVVPGELELVIGPEAALRVTGEALALRRGGREVQLLPTTRVRSENLDGEGAHKLLAGFALRRQVAPWAIDWGPLAGLPRTPRLTIDGFVVAPASFRIDPELVAACRGGQGRAVLDAWRQRLSVPRLIQVGLEDQLLPLDLDGAGALDELGRLGVEPPRAWEVWPPLDRLVGGRRWEAVVAVVRAAPLRRDAARAPRIAERAEAAGWRTFALVGAAARADRVLAGAIAPAVARALAARWIGGWFFQRYRAGARDELRLRVRGGLAGIARFARALAPAVEEAEAAGDLAFVEERPYLREEGRFGGPAGSRCAERIFESDSRLVVALAASAAGSPELLARSFDALARGLGLGLTERRALASAERSALEGVLDGEGDPLAGPFRVRGAALADALRADAAARGGDVHAPLFRAHQKRVSAAARALPPRQRVALAPSLIHLAAVRLAGPSRAAEAAGAYFWQRALESLAHHPGGAR